MKLKLLLIAVFLYGYNLSAQEQINLDNLNDFKEQAGNWQIVGDVSVNRHIDLHHEEEAEDHSKKKNAKGRKKETLLSHQKRLRLLLEQEFF